jgi:hypothetical protein
MSNHVSYDEFIEQCRKERRSLIHGIHAISDGMSLPPAPYGDMSSQLLNGMHEQLRVLERCIAAYDRHLN